MVGLDGDECHGTIRKKNPKHKSKQISDRIKKTNDFRRVFTMEWNTL